MNEELLKEQPCKDDYTEEDMEIDRQNIADLVYSGNAMHVCTAEHVKDQFDRAYKRFCAENHGTFTDIDILGLATRYVSNKKELKYHFISYNTLRLGYELMPCFTIVMTTTKKEFKDFKIDSPDGVFSYVYNFAGPDLSELGYTYFERKGKFPKRIG